MQKYKTMHTYKIQTIPTYNNNFTKTVQWWQALYKHFTNTLHTYYKRFTHILQTNQKCAHHKIQTEFTKNTKTLCNQYTNCTHTVDKKSPTLYETTTKTL